MPRPPRCRRVCALPATVEFGPVQSTSQTEVVILGLDEYEVIRLIDWVGLTQAECAKQINVARTTVTGMYDSARHKVADALVNGKRLLIEGGPIQICPRSSTCCHSCCRTGKKKIKEIDSHE